MIISTLETRIEKANASIYAEKEKVQTEQPYQGKNIESILTKCKEVEENFLRQDLIKSKQKADRCQALKYTKRYLQKMSNNQHQSRSQSSPANSRQSSANTSMISRFSKDSRNEDSEENISQPRSILRQSQNEYYPNQSNSRQQVASHHQYQNRQQYQQQHQSSYGSHRRSHQQNHLSYQQNQYESNNFHGREGRNSLNGRRQNHNAGDRNVSFSDQ